MRSKIWMVCLAVAVLAAAPMTAQLSGQDEQAMKGTEHQGVRLTGRVMTVAYSDTTIGGPLFDRQIGDCTGTSGLGPVNYQAELFYLQNAVGGICDINSVQDYDGYITVYLDPFDPADSTVNCIAGDDDGFGGIGTSDITGLALSGGTGYVLVTSGFAAGDAGAFTNTITCDVDVALGIAVPALGDMARVVMLILLLAGGVMFLRSRRGITGAPA